MTQYLHFKIYTQEIENRCFHKSLYPNVHSTIIYDRVEATKGLSPGGWTKFSILILENIISCRKKWSTEKWFNMDKPGKHLLTGRHHTWITTHPLPRTQCHTSTTTHGPPHRQHHTRDVTQAPPHTSGLFIWAARSKQILVDTQTTSGFQQ